MSFKIFATRTSNNEYDSALHARFVGEEGRIDRHTQNANKQISVTCVCRLEISAKCVERDTRPCGRHLDLLTD